LTGPGLRLALARVSVDGLEGIVAYVDETLRVISDRRVHDEWSTAALVLTAVDIPIGKQVLTEAEADDLAIAARAGPVPAELDALRPVHLRAQAALNRGGRSLYDTGRGGRNGENERG
jgi:hypothetical protein